MFLLIVGICFALWFFVFNGGGAVKSTTQGTEYEEQGMSTEMAGY